MIAALLLVSCTKLYTVHMGAQPPEDAHYILVRTNSTGNMLVYDCLSKPDGESWEPTCVKADMRSVPPETK
jgi:hypothetical protein